MTKTPVVANRWSAGWKQLSGRTTLAGSCECPTSSPPPHTPLPHSSHFFPDCSVIMPTCILSTAILGISFVSRSHAMLHKRGNLAHCNADGVLVLCCCCGLNDCRYDEVMGSGKRTSAIMISLTHTCFCPDAACAPPDFVGTTHCQDNWQHYLVTNVRYKFGLDCQCKRIAVVAL